MARASIALASFGLMLGLVPRGDAAQAQGDRVVAHFEQMSPRQRVGQLFLVAFYVPDAYYESPEPDPLRDARALIADHGIGGVVLQKGNNVFRNERGRDLPTEIAHLTDELQRFALAGPDGGTQGTPLFIAVDHEGDGDPLTHLREGFTAVPSAMAIGATYDPANAEAVGRIVGAELEAVGVNLLFGPVLDVLAEPRVDSGGDIGTRAFGGDPYWVQRMGAAYIEGVHRGGGRRVATVAKHFPGHGRSDRSTDDEVATVPKSIEELRPVELQPFSATTSGSPGDPDSPNVTDALMTSHIRYRAIREDGRVITPPVSFDREVLGRLLSMDGFPFEDWRHAGGLVVVDSLGVRAVRRHFNPAEDSFPNRLIARQALMAGNDVLVLAQFAVQADWSAALANIEDTLDYFTGEYRTDAAFRTRVDTATMQILRRKASLYPDWTVDAVAADVSGIEVAVGTDASRDVVRLAARDAVTELRALDRPHGGDKIVLVADFDRETEPAKLACPGESCGLPAEHLVRLEQLGPTLVEAFIHDGLGENGTGEVRPDDVRLVTFCQLRDLFRPPTAADPTTEAQPPPGAGPSAPSATACDPSAAPEDVRALLVGADWIVFAFADLSPTDVRDLRGLLLPQVNHLVRAGDRTRLAVLSFGPPYYIDQTNFFHLDAYYAAFSKIPPSIEAAVDALFGVTEPGGALPVDYEDAGLVLAERLSADPGQEIPVRLTTSTDPASAGSPMTVSVDAGPVLDHNGRSVPDGTIVTLTSDPPEALGSTAPSGLTVSGTARIQAAIAGGGHIVLRAHSDRARSGPLPLDVPLPAPTPSTALLAGPGEAPAAGEGESGQPASWITSPPRHLGPTDLFLALAAVALTIGAGATSRRWRWRAPEQQTRLALMAAIGGLSAFLVYGLSLRLASWPRAAMPVRGLDTLIIVVAGASAGLAIGAWLMRRATATPRAPAPPAGAR